MLEEQHLSLDHTDDRTGYLGITHRACNARAGAAVGAQRARERRSPTPLEEAVQAAVDQMTWLMDTDQALVALALRYANEIEAAVGTDQQSKLVGWLGPHLANTLKTLGGAPVERRELVGEEAVGGRLAQLRAARQ